MADFSDEYNNYLENPDAYHSRSTFYGLIPGAVDYSHLQNNRPAVSHTVSLEPSFSRSIALLTEVKNQNPYGTCWLFASLAALKASYSA